MHPVADAPDIVRKCDFADLIGVSRSRVTQYVAEGKLSGDALVGEGRAARIRVAVAVQQLGVRLDPAQAMGNGAQTMERLAALPAAPVASAEPEPREAPAMRAGPDRDYQLARARQAQADADMAEMKAAQMRREMLSSADVTEAMTRAAEIIVRAVERLVSDADELAEVARTGGAQAVRQVLRRRARAVRQAVADGLTDAIGAEQGGESDE